MQGTQKEITYDTFLDMVEDGKVKSVEFSNNTIQITPKNEKDNPLYSISMYYTGYVNDEELVETLKEAGVEFKSTIDDGSGSIIEFLMWNVVPFIFIFGITWLLFRPMFKGGGMMGVGKSNAKVYVEKETDRLNEDEIKSLVYHAQKFV